jgi:hypothetical protein
MHPTTSSRRSTLAALLCGASMLLASPQLLAQPTDLSLAGLATPGTGAAHAAARRDLARFIAQQLQPGQGNKLADLPFDVANLADLKDAVIGYGFAVHTVDPADLLAGRGSMQQMTRATGQWRFVVMLDNKPIGLVTVEKNQGRFETTAYCGAVLAKDIDALMNQHGNAERSNVRFVRIYQARADLLEVSGQNDGTVRFAPLHSARQSLGMQGTSEAKASQALVDEADLLTPLRAAVKSNLDAMR